MTPPRKSSIKRKMMRVIMLASLGVLLVTVAAFMGYDLVTFRQTMVQNLVTQARTIADNSTAALAFRDENDAANVLASLRSDPHIVAGAIYDAQGKLFVKYLPSNANGDVPAAPQSPGHQFGKSSLTVFQPVVQSGRRLGTLYLQSDLTALLQRTQVYGVSSLFIMAGSLVVALWLSLTLQRRISNPIVTLAATAQKISQEQNYSLRAPKLSDDELGSLTDAFNEMLERIQTATAALRASEAQFRFVTDNAPVLLAHMDRHYRYKFVNRAYAESYRRKPEEIIGRHAIEIVGVELFRDAQPYADKALAGESVQFELEIPGPEGERRWRHLEYTPEKNYAGEVVGFVAVLVDITERKKTEQAVRESARRERERAAELAVVIEAVPVPVVIVHDAEGRHMTGNRAALNLVRLPGGGEISKSAPEELKPRHFKSLKDGRELEPDELPAQRAARGEVVRDFEFELVFDDGTVLNLLGAGTPLLNESGKPRGAVHTLVDITERKRTEALLRAGERRFRQLADAMPQMVFITHPDGAHEYFNDRWYEFTGVPDGSLGGAGWEGLFHPDDEQRVRAQWKKNLASGELYEIEYRLKHRAGGYCWFLCRAVPVRDENGRILKWFGTCTDIENFKRAENALRQNEALFSALVDQAPNGVYVVDAQFRIQQINAGALPAFENVHPLIGRDFSEVMEILWGAAVGGEIVKIFRHTLATGERYTSPRFSDLRQDLGEDRAYEWETQRITLPDGTHGVVCYFNDITEAERNKANLAFLATIGDDLLRLETVNDILNTVCAKICDYLKLTIGCFVEINEAADTSHVTHEWRRPEMPGLLGTYKLSEYLSEDFQKILRAGECFIVRDTAADARTDAEKYAALKIRSFICVPLVADGRWKFMFDIHDSKPRDWRADEISLLRELTARIWARLERVRADALRRQNEALFAALIDEAPVGVYVVNAQFRIQQVNARALPAFEKVEPKIGRSLTDVMHIQWGQAAGDELAAIFRRTLDTGEPYISPGYSNIRADLGVEKTFEWQVRRVTLPNGSHGVVCYFNDITERIRSEQALREAKEAAEAASRSKDDFLAALSHELRTPLNPVLLVASDAANNPQLPANTRADFDMIRRNVELEARLIDDLLDLTRITRGKLALEMQPLDTLVVLQDAITTVQADAEQKHISFDFDFRAEQYLITGDAVRLRQIFWNVLKNAVKFTPAGGKITIETGTLKDSGKIAVKISDTGIGLTAEEIKHIFNAFSQGEHAGKSGSHRFGGLGLGLAISRMLVELHSGAIQAASAGRDQGATFTIEFPLLSPTGKKEDQHDSPDQPAPANSPKPKLGMRILLVEDHEPTRTILTQLLTRRHYTVWAAGCVAEANALARREKFDLVLSDIGLPDGNGYTLMSGLRDRFGLKGIALTGYGMDHDVTRAKNAGFITHLTKPVRMESLEKALADLS